VTERDRERGEGHDPLDEEAAWAEIVAGFGDRPDAPEDPDATEDPDTPGASDAPDVTASGPGPGEAGRPPVWHPDAVPDRDDRAKAGADAPADLSKKTDPGSADPEVNRLDEEGQWDGPGPRDWAPEEEGEGHFIPPDPGPLPETDLITRFAWLAVIGGPLLLVICAIFDIDVTWWITTAGIGGFLGGISILILGMRDDRDDEWTDPGSGAVV
jgi:hypothetical protein